MARRTILIWNNHRDEPMVGQASLNGWRISWCPDDEMFHVGEPRGQRTWVRRKSLRNARQWAKENEYDVRNASTSLEDYLQGKE